MTPPFLVAMLVPAFGAAVIYDSAWPVVVWFAVMIVSVAFWRKR